ncbi:hypothetical protein MOQ_002583 [Trypanosoma cruzi marinkellei]|uniref:Glycogenin glucosyltransferase n=1 Tax=Trypanosoma cruzi marinkellei TaxID=85056 RepID=K2N216_TRYCR|nr:hypothetical protein MOQ_002583 [Trypanosoma cruzi marinkellei]
MHRSKRFRSGLRHRRCWRCSWTSFLLILFFLVLNSLVWLYGFRWKPSLNPLSFPSDREGPAVVGPRDNELRRAGGNLSQAPNVALPGSENERDDDIIMPKNSDNELECITSQRENSSLLYVRFTGRKRLLTLEELIKKVHYNRNSNDTNNHYDDVKLSICPPLPKGVEIPINDSFEIGMIREFVGGMYHPLYCKQWKRHTPNSTENGKNKKDEVGGEYAASSCSAEVQQKLAEAINHPPKYAYVMMVSNHRYLDGAMVLADSIREYSLLSRNHEADIVLIINENIKKEMFPLLQVVFDRVQIFRGMQKWAPKSVFKATFDKMYLYMLEDYTGGILFLDADTLVTDNPDFLLQMQEKIVEAVSSENPGNWTEARRAVLSYPLEESEWKRLMRNQQMPFLFAVGDKQYFQTGLIILRPSLNVLLKLYLEFRLGKYGYNRVGARDGVLFRKCFTSIGKLMRRPYGVYHFTGTPKPWFNLEYLDHTLRPIQVKMRQQLKLSWKDYKIRYEWWTRYERLHLEYFQRIELETRARCSPAQDAELIKWQKKYGDKIKKFPSDLHITKYGGVMLLRRQTRGLRLPLGINSLNEATRASPNSYMWLMRFSKDVEYLHPVRAHMAKLRTYDVPLASAHQLDSLLSAFNSSSSTMHQPKGIAYAFAAPPHGKGGNIQDGLWSNCKVQCARLGLRCNASLLMDTRISDCQHGKPLNSMANGLIFCKRCLPYYKTGAPFVVFKKNESNTLWIREAEACFFNAWTRFAVPRCNAIEPKIHEYELQQGEFLAPVCACQ